MGACQFGGFDDFFFGCAGFAVCNIFVDTAGEEVNVLLDYAYVASQALERYFFDVLVVEEDFTLCGIVKTGEQVAECCLSASGGPTRATFSPGLMVRSISARTGVWSSGYSKDTCLKVIFPSTL